MIAPHTTATAIRTRNIASSERIGSIARKHQGSRGSDGTTGPLR
jgi:hypothetical protein